MKNNISNWYKDLDLIQDSKKEVSSPLENIIIQTTSFCNLACKYCYLPDKDIRNRFDLSLIPVLFENLENSNLLGNTIYIYWHSGEPLVLPVSYYRNFVSETLKANKNRANISFGVQTNGSLISQEYCDFFKEFDINVGVSIDGPQILNDKNRIYRNGKGSYERVIKGIDLLKKNQVDFGAIAVFDRQAFNHLEEIIQFFKNINPTTELGLNFEEYASSDSPSSIRDFSIEEAERYHDKILNLTTKEKLGFSIRDIDELTKVILGFKDPSFSDRIPLKILSIGTNGDFSTFSPQLFGADYEEYNNFIFGNISTDYLSDIYDNPYFKKVNNEIKKGVGICAKTCEYFEICKGGSPSNKLYENGTFSSSETNFCKFSKKGLANSLMNFIQKNE